MALSILDHEWTYLSGTKTFAVRHVYWCPCVSPTHRDADSSDAAVSIHQQHREHGKIEDDQYSVSFNGPAVGAMGYSFTFENLNPPKHPKPNETVGPYTVTVGPTISHCTCKAGQCEVNVCKHRSAACRAIYKGLVDGASSWPGMPEQHEEYMPYVEPAVWGAEPDEEYTTEEILAEIHESMSIV